MKILKKLKDGSDIYLTIDSSIQFIAEKSSFQHERKNLILTGQYLQ